MLSSILSKLRELLPPRPSKAAKLVWKSKLNITSIPTFFIYINGELKQDKEVAYDILKSVQE